MGALAGGKLVLIGRRKAVFVSSLVGFAGISLTMYFNFYAILIGRLLFGLYAGLSSVIIPKYMNETVPVHLFDVFGPLFNVFCGCG